jgi:glycosyltransferase involved in cell wall biosynthesis
MRKIKLLLIYHNAGSNAAKSILSSLGKHPLITLRVLAPEGGWDPLNRRYVRTDNQITENYTLVTGKIYKSYKDFSKPYIWGLEKEIIRFKPDIIHVFYEATSRIVLQALIYRKLFRPKAKVLYFGFENIFPDDWFVKPLTRRFYWKYVCNNIDGGAYANTEGLNRLIEMGLPAETSRVLYWGIPLENYNYTEPFDFKRKLGLTENFILGYVGRIEKAKGLNTVLKALEFLPDDTILFILGSGDYKNALNSKIDEKRLSKRVFLKERVPETEVGKYMSLFDILVLPSETTTKWKEQFGRVIPEAMSCGIPVLGSDSGAIPEVIGDAGFVFNEGNHTNLAENVSKVRLLDENDRIDLKQRMHLRVTDHFSIETFVEKLVELYSDIY